MLEGRGTPSNRRIAAQTVSPPPGVSSSHAPSVVGIIRRNAVAARERRLQRKNVVKVFLAIRVGLEEDAGRNQCEDDLAHVVRGAHTPEIEYDRSHESELTTRQIAHAFEQFPSGDVMFRARGFTLARSILAEHSRRV